MLSGNAALDPTTEPVDIRLGEADLEVKLADVPIYRSNFANAREQVALQENQAVAMEVIRDSIVSRPGAPVRVYVPPRLRARATEADMVHGARPYRSRGARQHPSREVVHRA